MKASPSSPADPRGFTLIEISLVICVLLALMTSTFYTTNAVKDWKLARDASENLRTVYVAQRTYLADNPTVPVTSLTPALLLPYLPSKPAAMPTSKSLDKTTLYPRVNVSPPYLTTNSNGIDGTRYDPSKSTTDSQWDVGE